MDKSKASLEDALNEFDQMFKLDDDGETSPKFSGHGTHDPNTSFGIHD